MTSHGGFQGKPVRGQPVLAQNEQRWGSGTSWAVSETRDTTCGHTHVLGPALGHAGQSGTPLSGQQGPSAWPWVTGQPEALAIPVHKAQVYTQV